MINKTDAIAFLRRRPLVVAVLVLLLALTIHYFAHIPAPPGFYIDESSISYNAYTISQTLRDESGTPWPLYFRAFDDYKNPVYIYLLAAVFRLTGPNIFVARLLSAMLGLAAALLLGLLAFRLTGRWVVSSIILITAFLTPWLFELSRVVLEVSLYPLVLALFLLCVYRASRRERWSWFEIASLSLTLALLTYSYSIGRLLGPLLSIGLLFFATRRRWTGLLLTGALYGLMLVPMLIFRHQHPDALTRRFSIITYIKGQNTFGYIAWEFVKHFVGNLNPWRLLVRGDPNAFQITHIYGAELLLFVTGLLSVAGLFLVFRYYLRDSWWQFVVYGTLASVVPASLTNEYVHTLRLAPLAVFLIVLTIPALDLLVRNSNRIVICVLVLMIVLQGVAFQWRFHRAVHSQRRLDLFDNSYPDKIFSVAVASSKRPIYLEDAEGIPGYIQAFWYATLRNVPLSDFVRLEPDAEAPSGALVISTESRCRRCEIVATHDFYKMYVVTAPAPERKPLDDFRASIKVTSVPAVVNTGDQFIIPVNIKNESNSVWLAHDRTSSRFRVSLGNHWLDGAGRVVINDDGRSPLLDDVSPGQEVSMSLTVNAPTSSGDFILEIDMLQEGVSWFGLKGSPTARVPIKVEARWWR